MPNVNSQTIYQMGSLVNDVVKQATGRDPVQSIEMANVTVAQNTLMGIETQSGSFVSFVKPKSVPLLTLVAQIVAQQDLNGYDYPWQAGGNYNKFDGEVEIGGLSTSTGGNIDQTDRQRSKNYMPVTAGNSYYFYRETQANHTIFYYNSEKVLLSYTNMGNANGSFLVPENASFVRFVINSTTLDIQVSVNYPNTYTSYIPYSNICPIIGWTGCEVNRTGVNVWDEEWELGLISSSNGENATGSTTIRSKNYILVAPNTTYYIYFGNVSGGQNFQCRFYDSDKNYIGYVQNNGTVVNKNQTFKTPATAQYMRFQVQADYGTTYNHDISINYPATDTEYHSGTQNETYSIEFPSEAETVYGGTLDVVNGVLTVTDAVIASYDGEELPSTWISDRDVYSEGTTPTTGAQVVYKLAEPLTFELTQQQVTTLVGQNNVLADTGDVSLSYYVYFDLL